MGGVVQFYARDDGSYTLFGTLSARAAAAETDEIEVVLSTEAIADDGDVIEATTWDLRWYRKLLGSGGGPVLRDHDTSRLIGTAHRVKRDNDKRELRAWYRHLPEGVTAAGDEARRLRKAGVRMPVSVRWRPRELIPLNELPADHPAYRDKPVKLSYPWGTVERMPKLHRGAELREFSEVVMPSDRGAIPVRSSSAGLAVPTADQIRVTLQRMARDRDPALCEVLAEMVEASRLSMPACGIDEQAWGGPNAR